MTIQFCDAYIDGLVQERRNSIANALELRLSALTHRYMTQWLQWVTGFSRAPFIFCKTEIAPLESWNKIDRFTQIR